MASRYGFRPVGSDGSDFQHRERVVQPYNQSPLFKKRLRAAFTLQVALWFLVMLKILPEIMFKYNLVSRQFMRKYPVPPNDLWEYAWCGGSILSVFLGYLSFGKNKISFIRLSIIGTLVFGVVPVVMGCFLKASELMDYYYTKHSKHHFLKFPFIVLLYIFFSVCIQLHFFTLYFSWHLMTIWCRLSKKSA